MRIDSSGNVKIGDSSTDITSKLTVSGNASSDVATFMYDGSAGTFLDIDCAGANGAVNLRADARTGAYPPLLFTTGSTEAMRIDASGNLGLGVTPSAWNSGYKAMQLLTGALYGTSSRDTNLGANVFVNAGGGYAYIQSSFATNYTQFNGAHSWYTAPSGTAGNAITFTQAMTLDASGNVGIGNTIFTSARVTAPHLVVGSGSASPGLTLYGAANSQGSINFADSTSGTDSYDGGIVYGFGSGSPFMSFHVNGGAEAMRIDSSGNVGIGATSAITSTYLSKAFVYTAGGANFAIGGSSDTNDAVLSRFTSFNISNSNSGNESSANFYGVTSIESIVVTTDSNAGDDSGGSLLFKTKPEAGILAERMRIDSSGNVGIGVVPSAWAGVTGLQLSSGCSLNGSGVNAVLGANSYYDGTNWKYIVSAFSTNYYSNYANDGSHVWQIAPSGTAGDTITYTHAMTLNASGNLLVGTTSNLSVTPKLAIESTTFVVGISSTNPTGELIRFYGNSRTVAGSISHSGSSVAYNTSSDQRLKENITDADDAGSKIDAIQVRKFDWKVDGSHQDYGMVAQELLEVAPEAVSAPEDPEDMMGVDYSKLVPMMLKEIQSLRARIAALES
jgi:hypothetical protein